MAEERINQDTPAGENEQVLHVDWHDKATGHRGTDSYTVTYRAILHEHRWQDGHPAVWSTSDLNPIDTRKCYQDLIGRIEREVRLQNPRRSDTTLDRKHSTTTAVAIRGEGTGPGLGNLFRSQNCNDTEAEFNRNASTALNNLRIDLASFLPGDRASLLKDLVADYKVAAVGR